jgi:hypothetical protein
MNKFPIVTEFASAEVPLFLEKKNKNLVYFGVNNMYPFELIDLYNDSSTHNAIINGKVGYTVGNGLHSDDIKVKKWLSQANIDEDWTSLMKRLSLDYELFNGYAIEVIKTGAGNQYHHIDFANIRVGLDGGLQYADNWITEKGTPNSKPDIQYLERYNPRNPEQKRGVIYHVDYRPNMKYYPLPVYVGSLAEIKTDVQIGDYWLSEISNGFVGGTLIQHNNGVPETKEESEDFEKAFQEKFGKATGTKIVHLFSPSKDNGSEITNLNGNDLHERYIEMSNRVKESIFIGHRITNPILFGVKEEGALGARNELDLAYEIFTNTYIAERQNTLLRTIRKLAFFEIQRTDIDIIPLKPIDTVDLTSDIILGNLSREEIRDLINEQTGLQLQEELIKGIEHIDVVAPTEPIGEAGEVAEVVDTEKEQKEASYNGAQIASALSIVELVKAGTLSISQGKAALMEFLRLSEEVSLRLLEGDESAISMCSHFSQEENISHLFDNIGVSEHDYEILESLDINFDKDGSPIEFATAEQETSQKILKAVLDNPLIALSELAALLELSFDELIGSISVLSQSNLLVIEGSTLNLTPVGEKIGKTLDIPSVEIKYRYSLRPDAPALKEGSKSRDFCEDMIRKYRLYSKAEIELLRNDMPSSGIADVTNVWLARGGWYRKPDTDTSIPYCRHIWRQVIVRKK